MIGADAVVRRAQGVLWRELDGKVVGLDLASSRYFSLNSTGALLWERLADDVTVPELVEALVAAHAVTPEQAEADTLAFLSSLDEHGLLE